MGEYAFYRGVVLCRLEAKSVSAGISGSGHTGWKEVTLKKKNQGAESCQSEGGIKAIRGIVAKAIQGGGFTASPRTSPPHQAEILTWLVSFFWQLYAGHFFSFCLGH